MAMAGKSMAAALALIAASAAPAALADEPAQRTINDKVFSFAQVVRGKQAYRATCAPACHLITMTGFERTPGLAGDSFMLRWNGQTLGDMFVRMKFTMPQTAPRSLPDQTYVDIMAYVLSANGLPPGDAELTPDVEALSAIKFVVQP